MNKRVIINIVFILFLSNVLYSKDVKSIGLKSNDYDLKPYVATETEEHIPVKEPEKKQIVNTDDPIRGSIRFLDLFECKKLLYKRGIWIWLPEGYKEDFGPYSVIYFHDAQNLFLPSKSFSGKDWKVDETIIDLMNKKQIRPTIVVGIPNSPARDEELNLATKEGKYYCDFVINEIMPFVKERFPVSKKVRDHIIAGSSMGGLMSFQMAFEHPDKFGGAICMSSAFLRKLSNIIDRVKTAKNPPLKTKFYIDSGDLETIPEEGFTENILDLYKEMKEVMKKAGFKEGINLKTWLEKGANHNEEAWAKRLPVAIQFMLKK